MPAPDLPDDDDRTVIRPAPRGPAGHVLPIGTTLEGFEITGLIGEGGFGIVYRARDAALDRDVAIKEYMPASLARRDVGGWQVSVKSERQRDTFEAGLRSFVNEARLLARFDHPALLKVFRFWEANRTAYMAMPLYEGPTLKAALMERGTPPDEAQLRAWLTPLLDALAVLHQERCYHRDIAPDNILLTPRGPLLLDFGAARQVIGDRTHALTVVLKPGYAPIEQYGGPNASAQGPWTDLYALASVVHYAITSRAPASSPERIVEDRVEPLAKRVAGRYSAGFLRAIDQALAVRPTDRPQNVAQFRALLDVVVPEPAPLPPTVILPPPPAAVPIPPIPVPVPLPPAPGAASQPRRRLLWLLPAGLVLVAGAAALWRSLGGGDTKPPAAAASAAPAPVVVAAPEPAPAPEVAPPPAPAPEPVPAPTPEPAPPAPPPAPPPAAPAPAPPVHTEAPPPKPRRLPARCSDILQKASLEPLSAEEADYLKRECR